MSRKAAQKVVSYAEDSGDDASSPSDAVSEDESMDQSDSESDAASGTPDSPPAKKSKKASTPPKAAAKSKGKASATKKASPGKPKPAASIGAKKPAVTSSSSTATVAGPSSSSASLQSSSLPGTASSSSGGRVDITQGAPVTTDTAAKKLLQQYMKQQNRPYSLQQIYDNLHQRIPKATLERVLAAMSVPGGGLCCKEYGKAKLFYVDQSTMSADYTQEQFEDLIANNEELKRQVAEKAAEEKELRAQVNRMMSEPDDDELVKLLAEAEERVAAKTKKLEALTSHGKADPRALENAVRKFNFYRTAWIERRAQCMDVVDSISEAMGKKPKDFMRELGMETDQDVNAVVPPVMKIPAHPKK